MTIKEIREALGMTQKALAIEIGGPTFSDQNISRWERGICRPLGIFQVKIDELEVRAKSVNVVNGEGI